MGVERPVNSCHLFFSRLCFFFFASMFHAGNGKIETRDYQEPKQVRNGNSNFHCDELFEIDFREICLKIKCSSPSWRCLFSSPPQLFQAYCNWMHASRKMQSNGQ